MKCTEISLLLQQPNDILGCVARGQRIFYDFERFGRVCQILAHFSNLISFWRIDAMARRARSLRPFAVTVNASTGHWTFPRRTHVFIYVVPMPMHIAAIPGLYMYSYRLRRMLQMMRQSIRTSHRAFNDRSYGEVK